MRLENYFRDELNYLRIQGREFAQVHPELVRFLSEPGTDSDVERLLEGFAFLTGSLRAKIEDEFPELTFGLLSMLWNNYLRPVPSMTVLQFSPVRGSLIQPMLVSKGCEVDSIPVPQNTQDVQSEQDAVVCHFQTCRDLWVYPAEITQVSVYSGNNISVITLDFSLYAECLASQLQLDKLCLYPGGGDNWTACELFYWLSDRLSGVDLEINGTQCRREGKLLKSAGFEREDALLPYPDNVYSGYRILQEFFCFPYNFLFFRLPADGWQCTEQKVKSFKLHLRFDRPLPDSIKIRTDSFILNCVPAINLFRHESEPVMLDGLRTEYPLKASYQYADSMEIFSVDDVTGRHPDSAMAGSSAHNRIFQPFESFRHQIERAKGRESLYYRLRLREAINGQGFEHLISFVRSDETEVVSLKEVVSATLTCTNRDMAIKLKTGDICHFSGADIPSFATCSNIMRPTRSLRPILDASLHWMLISNMSLNYVSLLHRDALAQILRTYDFPALYDKQAEQASRKRMAGIESITTVPLDRLITGVPVRGLKSVLSVRQSAFSGEGELYLFGTVLAQFLSLYASVNAFHMLEIINLDNQECYLWSAKTGQRAVM